MREKSTDVKGRLGFLVAFALARHPKPTGEIGRNEGEYQPRSTSKNQVKIIVTR